MEHIQQLRRQAGMTQAELADAADVSQSLIAKIETGRVDPSHSKAERIRTVLQRRTNEQATTAGEVQTENVYTCHPRDALEDVIELMQTHDISQVPVVREGTPVGLVTESTLLTAVEDAHDAVASLMDDASPTVSSNTPVPVLTALLQHVPLVIVTEEGTITGVVTKADVIQTVV